MTTNNPGWVGVGLGKRGMTEVDMHVAEFVDKDNYKVIDMYSFGKYRPSIDTEIGGTDNIFNSTYIFKDNQYVVTYLRKLDGLNDKYDYNIPLV